MPSWSPRLFLACLLCAPACGDPEPPPSTDESSTSSDTTSTTNPTTTSTTTMGTTSMPTTGPNTGDTTTGPNDSTSSGSTSSGSTSSGSTGSGSTSDASTGTGSTGSGSGSSGSTGSGSTSDASSGSTGGGSTGGGSTGGGSTGGGSTGATTGVDPCAAGDGPDFIVTNNGFTDYVVDGVNDPDITLVRGCSYTFDVTAVGHPFWIKTVAMVGVGNAYNDGVVNNGTSNGLITWDVSLAAPNTLFYICEFHALMTGTINIIGP